MHFVNGIASSRKLSAELSEELQRLPFLRVSNRGVFRLNKALRIHEIRK